MIASVIDAWEMGNNRQDRRRRLAKFKEYQKKLAQVFERDDIEGCWALAREYGNPVPEDAYTKIAQFHKARFEFFDVSDLKRFESRDWLAANGEPRLYSDIPLAADAPLSRPDADQGSDSEY